MKEVPYSVRSAGPAAVKHYLSMVAAGQSQKFAEMCAVQCPPGVRGTDRAVMQGRNNGQWLDQMPPSQAREILAIARRAGINVEGKYYQSGLADKRGPGDPAAWIDSAADIKKVAQLRNLHVTGIVEHKAHEVEPQTKVLSENVIRSLVKKYKKLHPGKKTAELREMVVDKHAPRFKKGKK